MAIRYIELETNSQRSESLLYRDSLEADGRRQFKAMIGLEHLAKLTIDDNEFAHFGKLKDKNLDETPKQHAKKLQDTENELSTLVKGGYLQCNQPVLTSSSKVGSNQIASHKISLKESDILDTVPHRQQDDSSHH